MPRIEFMSLTYKHFWTELVNSIPRLAPALAQRFINRAWHDIQDSRQWSFLKASGVYYTPAIINSGSFNVTQFSNSVIASATAITALNNITNPLITQRQIRFGSGSTNIYNISAISPTFSSDGIIYIDQPYLQTSSTSTGYRCYRCYYGPPLASTLDAITNVATQAETSDFLRINDIYNPANSRWFYPGILPREILDRHDPQRANSGSIPRGMFAYKSINNLPYFEMYPHPLYSNMYPCSYQKKGSDFSIDTEILPSIIPDELLMERAMFYACEWASKNQARYPELKGINWRLEQSLHKQTYSNISSRDPGLLEIAQRNDEETFPQNTVIDARDYNTSSLGYDDIMIYPSLTI